MKVLGVVTVSVVLLCVAAAARGEPRDSVDRGDRLDRDAIRDDVRIDRLKVPRHPLSAEQPLPQQEPASTSSGKRKSKKKEEIR
jgi:hypothetical protein